jgi:multicomponent Na+:H+ antiporter subunit D
MTNHLILLLFIIPLITASAFIIIKNKTLSFIISIISTLLTLCLPLFYLFASKPILYLISKWNISYGINLALDNFSLYILIVTNLALFIYMFFASSFFEKINSTRKFYALIFLFQAGINGLVISGDLISLYIFIEIASIAYFSLTQLSTNTNKKHTFIKYVVLHLISASFILLGIIYIFTKTQTFNLMQISQNISSAKTNSLYIAIIALMVLSFCIKTIILPFFIWLSNKQSNLITSILSTISNLFISVIGLYLITRFCFNVLFPAPALCNSLSLISIICIILGTTYSLKQKHQKSMLAYHSLNEVGIILLGLSLGTPLGIMGSIFHLVNHTICKSSLLFNATYSEYYVNEENKPFTCLIKNSNILASLSTMGIPPFNCFWSKVIIIFACIQSGNNFLALLATTSSIFGIVAFAKALKQIAFGISCPNQQSQLQKTMKTPIIALIILCILSCLLILPKIRFKYLDPVKDTLVNGSNYKNIWNNLK